MSTIIRVTGEHPSTITVGHGLGFEPIREALDEAATKVLIVHARPLASRAKALAQYLREQGIDASTADHPDAEAGKSIEVVASLWDECGRLQVGRKDAIVAMGGGAAATPAVRELLSGHTVVYIDAPHEELVRRTASKTHRPLLAEDPSGTLARLRTEREPHYRAVATIVVESGPGPVDDVVTAIALQLEHS